MFLLAARHLRTDTAIHRGLFFLLAFGAAFADLGGTADWRSAARSRTWSLSPKKLAGGSDYNSMRHRNNCRSL